MDVMNRRERFSEHFWRHREVFIDRRNDYGINANGVNPISIGFQTYAIAITPIPVSPEWAISFAVGLHQTFADYAPLA
jgi:hypothetical protein